MAIDLLKRKRASLDLKSAELRNALTSELTVDPAWAASSLRDVSKQNRQVTFRQSSYEPVAAAGGTSKYTFHGEDIDLNNPTAPYHTNKVASKRRKGPRSCPGQDFDDEDSQNSGDLNRSFQSEFITTNRPSKSARRRNNHYRPKYEGENSMINEVQRQPFGQSSNANGYVNQSSRLERSFFPTKDPNKSMDSSSTGGDWEVSKEHAMKMHQQILKYKNKLAKVIGRERLARQELEQEKIRRNETEDSLRQRIYELERQNLKLQTCLDYERERDRRMIYPSMPSYEPPHFIHTPNMMLSTFMNTATTSSVATADGAGEHLVSRSQMPYQLHQLETPDETKVFRQNDSDSLSQRPMITPLMSNISTTSSVDIPLVERPRSNSKMSSCSILTLTQRKPPLLQDDGYLSGYKSASVADDTMSMRSRNSTREVPKKNLRRSLSLTLS